MQIGIISEGFTDQIVLESILIGFFGDKDLPVNPLQPLPNTTGNWDKVFKYCESEDFKGALPYNDLLIVQLDTDFMQQGEVSSTYKVELNGLSTEQIVHAMTNKLIELIGVDFYEKHKNQIVFAIAVDAIECWFLPIYYDTQPKKATKTSGCLDTLNKVLPQKEGFFIAAKEAHYYQTISKHFQKQKKLQKYSAKNPSFDIFISQLVQKTTLPESF
ncbi:MAG: hypothetical protein KA168_03900 [Chitinophagales bacterium]|jgi:hypothetical protein|nr:hypothetical protein [Chitinophagales bacterium]